VAIRFSLPYRQYISLKVYNILGKEVQTVKSGELSGGEHFFHWSGIDQNDQSVVSGVYFLVLTAKQGNLSQKIVLIR